MRKGVECQYTTVEGETRTKALRREHERLVQENQELKALFDLLRSRPQNDAYHILNRIRTADDPLMVFYMIQHADLLLNNSIQQPLESNADLEKLEKEAWNKASIKVPARPWTAIGRDSIVSELVSSFFANDHKYLAPFIYRGVFLKDMRSQAVEEAKYCSPLLVNAMCALKSVRFGYPA